MKSRNRKGGAEKGKTMAMRKPETEKDDFTTLFLYGLRELIQSADMELEEVATLWSVPPEEASRMLNGKTPMAFSDAARLWLALRGRELELEENSPASMVALSFEILSSISEKGRR